MKQVVSRSRVVAFSGGVGGAKLANGLANVVDGELLAIVVNTGDDFEHLGLTVCPDIDSVIYALAGKNDIERGWGRAAETWHFMEALKELSRETWFQLGDRDLAMHVYRSWRLRQGAGLSAVTAETALSFKIRARILPMSDEPVRTLVHTDEGVLDFQHYFVARRAEPRVTNFEFAGSERARPPPNAEELMHAQDLAAVVICPSNPFVSIGPILAIDAWSRWLSAQSCPVIAVSPFVGRRALKGPAAKMIRELGKEPSTSELVNIYGNLVGAWVVDVADSADVAELEHKGIRCLATDTVMRNVGDQTRLARAVLNFARSLGSRRA